MHYAHSTKSSDCTGWQPLDSHLRAVAQRAGERGEKFGVAKAAALAGLLHDLGKYAQTFQAYIKGESHDGGDHSTAGAQTVLQLASAPHDKLMADLLTYAIAGHHAGLPDRHAETGSLGDRLKKTVSPLDLVWQHEITPEATGLAPSAFKQNPDNSQHPFQLAFLGRMIFSCLVDADFLDTEDFYAKADGHVVDREWPLLPKQLDRLIAAFDRYMTEKRLGAEDTALNRLRGDILIHVRQKACLTPGVFTLDVPTGGGKTLASLAFALNHAKQWQMDRIIYAIPFTSIIDQTAAIFRAILGEDVVLEHHSAIEENKSAREDDFKEGASDAKLRLAMENWGAPIVVTTNVQLFESLFANRTSRCRKLHNLAKAVIILDEAQNIPLAVLRPCVAALKELAANYGCTIVLCTATQPALAVPGFEGGFELTEDRELAPHPQKLHAVLRRVTLQNRGKTTDAELIAALNENAQGLVIVNSRWHALELYQSAEEAGLDGLVHLTTRQVAADRRVILADLRQRLANKQLCRVIATSLVEAGVDISFPRVWRAEAGLDQIIQAAGRCNREWEWPVGDSFVSIFEPAEAKPLPEIKALADAMARVSRKHADLFSYEAVKDYFGEVYWQRGDALDKHKIAGEFRMGGGVTDFRYRTVAEKFKLIESGMVPVIVAIDERPKQVLAALSAGRPPGQVARELQTYIVQMPPKQRAKLIANGHVAFVEGFGDQFAVLRTESFYNRETGLLFEKADELGFDGQI